MTLTTKFHSLFHYSVQITLLQPVLQHSFSVLFPGIGPSSPPYERGVSPLTLEQQIGAGGETRTHDMPRYKGGAVAAVPLQHEILWEPWDLNPHLLG